MITQAHSLAYLVSAYPAASHAFILREVLGLRARGWSVDTLSINRDTRPADTLSAEEQAEQRQTLVIKDWPRARLLPAIGQALRHFGGTAVFGALGRAWKLARPGWRGHGLALAYWLEAVLVANSLARKKIGHLHVHFGNEAALVGLLAKHIGGFYLSYTIHGPDEFHDAKGQQLAAKVAAADRIVCISDFARSQLMLFSAPRDWEKLQVVRLGIGAGFEPTPSRTTGDLRLLCVGRLTPAKGQHLLLRAMARLQKEGYAVSLVLAGGGSDEASLRAEAQRLQLKGIRFTGALPREAIRPLYDEADVFVLPSFAEGVPVVLMEAMACGLPCISTRIAGIPELIQDGDSGLLLPPGDVEALYKALILLCATPALRQRLGARARESVLQSYWLESNLDRLARCLHSITGGLHHA